jgi:membrane-associated protein
LPQGAAPRRAIIAAPMEIFAALWSFVTHLDTELASLLQQYGTWIYAILFAIVFCETGLVVAPFLPGDSLLFVAGALWAASGMEIDLLMATLVAAALCGDNCNYWIGRTLARRVLGWQHSRFFNRKLFDRTQAFYARHGGKTVVLARFVPLVRTFAPFVAGVGHMPYVRFLLFSVLGAVLWVGILVPVGYWFGNIQFVRDHFEIVALVIVAISLLPLAIEFVRHRLRMRRDGARTAPPAA